MSTYIQGLTDYIPQIQSFKPDYNFLSNVLQTRQSRYDNAYDQLSSVYTSLYNSPMMRDSDIARKDAFFKNIDQNIKKISGLDLSLQQNVDAANKVFQPFYDDKNMVNDMVKTKKYQNGLSKHESLKNCTDPTKCFEEAWDTGLQELQYKAQEFKNSTDEEALSFDMPNYTGYYNWKKDAIKSGIEKGFDVSQDSISGNWIVKDTNGNLVKGGLYSLYETTYGSDPRVNANYKSEAYVNRMNSIQEGLSKGLSKEQAELSYLNSIIPQSSKTVTKLYNDFNNISNEMAEKITAQQNKAKTSGITPDEEDSLEFILQNKQAVDVTANSLEETHNTIHNNADSKELSILRQRGDAAYMFALKERDMTELATTMSLKGKKHDISVNPFALADYNSNLQLRNALVEKEYDRETQRLNIEAKYAADIGMYDLKTHGIASGAVSTTPTVIKNDPGATDFKISDNEQEVGYQGNLNIKEELQSKSINDTNTFVYGAFNTAQLAANNGSISAKNYMSKTYGPGWDKVKTAEDFNFLIQNNKKDVNAIFSSTLNDFNVTKNVGSNLDWAVPFMKDKGAVIQQLQIEQRASKLAAQHITTTNKDVVKKIQQQYGPSNPEFKDADLLLDYNGFVVSNPEYFKLKYEKKYGVKADDKVYEKLHDKFFNTYNTTPGVMINQAAGLNGVGTSSAKSLQWNDINKGQWQNPGFTKLNSVLTDLTDPNNAGLVKAVPNYTPIKGDNVDDNSAELLNFANTIKSDLINAKGINPNIDFVERPITAGDRDLSAISIKVKNPKYLEQYIGTAKNPTPLYQYKDQIMNGFSIVYPNKQVKTSTTDALSEDPVLTVLKYEGIDFNHWPKAGKISTTLDPTTNMVKISMQQWNYALDKNDNKYRGFYTQPDIKMIPLSEYKDFYKSTPEALRIQQDKMIALEKKIALANKK